MWTIGVSSSAKAVVARTRIPRSDASTAVTALNVNAASAVGIAMGTVNATESTAESARETRSGRERDGTVIVTAIGNVIATATVSAVIGTDETKRIAIERAGKNARPVVERYSPWKTAASLLVRDIALRPLPTTHSGNEEGLVKMRYVIPPLYLSISLSCLSWFTVRPHFEA